MKESVGISLKLAAGHEALEVLEFEMDGRKRRDANGRTAGEGVRLHVPSNRSVTQFTVTGTAHGSLAALGHCSAPCLKSS